MSSPVYNIYLARGTAYSYSLDEAGRNKIMQIPGPLQASLGVKSIVVANCFWSSRWQIFGIEEFPDIDSYLHYDAKLQEAEWHRYIKAENYIGICSQPVVPQAEKSGFYKLYFSTLTADAFALTENDRNQAMAELGKLQNDHQMKSVMMGEVISSEHFSNFGLEYFPTWEAVVDYRRALDARDWFRYVKGTIYLGTPTG